MNYVNPQILVERRASATIEGSMRKGFIPYDAEGSPNLGTSSAYEADE
jgi:hypothetical protein